MILSACIFSWNLFVLSFLPGCDGFWSFFCQLSHLQFFCIFHFFDQKNFVLKSLLFCPFINRKNGFQKCFEILFVWHIFFCVNSCITYFSFLPRLRNISPLFLNFVSGELPYFFCFFVFPFLFFSFSIFCLYLVNLPFCSLFCSLVFFTLFLFFHLFSFIFFHHFFAFILSTLLLAWFFHGLPFLVRLKKTVPFHFLSPLSQFFSTSLFPNCLFFVSSFHPLSLFSFLSVFFFPFFPSFFHSCHGI